MHSYNFFKRSFDLAISLLAIIILAPFFLVAAILILADSGRPVFFAQERVGRDGRIFRLLKFRTMIPDALTRGPKLTERSDPRITRAGRFLRRWKIDEWPQFINVLLGQMSMVGPRPEIPHIVDRYTRDEKEVLSARPGIFGPSQIINCLEEEVYPERIDVEEYYMKNILPAKLERDRLYLSEGGPAKDMRYLISGMVAVIRSAWGRHDKDAVL